MPLLHSPAGKDQDHLAATAPRDRINLGARDSNLPRAPSHHPSRRAFGRGHRDLAPQERQSGQGRGGGSGGASAVPSSHCTPALSIYERDDPRSSGHRAGTSCAPAATRCDAARTPAHTNLSVAPALTARPPPHRVPPGQQVAAPSSRTRAPLDQAFGPSHPDKPPRAFRGGVTEHEQRQKRQLPQLNGDPPELLRGKPFPERTAGGTPALRTQASPPQAQAARTPPDGPPRDLPPRR